MHLASPRLSVSASNIDTFEACHARFYFEKSNVDRIPTDGLAANVGGAIHGALMNFHDEVKSLYLQGRLATVTDPSARLHPHVDKWLRKKYLDKTNPRVAERLAGLLPGLNRVACLIVADMRGWAADRVRKELLVWAEQRLDHGPTIPAVDFGPGFLVTTRPDVIGFRPTSAGDYRAVVRDFKTRNDALNPAFDVGALVRGIWVITELRDPRCPWFVVGRSLPIDRTGVDLEMINLASADGDDFIVTASLTAERLLDWRTEFRRIIATMGDVLGALNADEVLASPNGLCYQYCPFLHHCDPGQEYVRDNKGEDVLAVRLDGR